MGRYATLYVGPYAVCEATPQPTVVRVRSCPAPACRKPKPTREHDDCPTDFCSSCGTGITLNDITVKRYPSAYDALANERLSPVQRESIVQQDGIARRTVYFICNEGGVAARNFHIKPESHVAFEEFYVEHETRWFEERYAVELAQLKLHYGNCTLHWGVHYFAR